MNFSQFILNYLLVGTAVAVGSREMDRPSYSRNNIALASGLPIMNRAWATVTLVIGWVYVLAFVFWDRWR